LFGTQMPPTDDQHAGAQALGGKCGAETGGASANNQHINSLLPVGGGGRAGRVGHAEPAAGGQCRSALQEASAADR
jgi:hypothetical protein